MKKEEFQKQPWFPAIKGSTRDLIAAAGGIDRVTLFLGCGRTVVGNWNNWHMADLMPQWAMIALEADLGRPVLSAAYARLTGATVHDPVINCDRAKTLVVEMAVLTHEFSECLTSHSDASADGEYTIPELRDLREKLVDLDNQVAASIRTVDRKIAARSVGEPV